MCLFFAFRNTCSIQRCWSHPDRHPMTADASFAAKWATKPKNANFGAEEEAMAIIMPIEPDRSTTGNRTIGLTDLELGPSTIRCPGLALFTSRCPELPGHRSGTTTSDRTSSATTIDQLDRTSQGSFIMQGWQLRPHQPNNGRISKQTGKNFELFLFSKSFLRFLLLRKNRISDKTREQNQCLHTIVLVAILFLFL